MLTDYIPIELDDGSIIYMQSISALSGNEVLASGDEPQKAAEVMNKAMSSVTRFVGETKKKLEALKPDEIELEFSFTVTTDMNAIIASAGAEGGITVHLVWKKDTKN